MNTHPCNLCGSQSAGFVLNSDRLEGPLFKCNFCGLYFVHSDREVETAPVEMERLAERARDLSLVEPEVEQGENPWRRITAAERLRDLSEKTGLKEGDLLEIGSSTGEFLEAAEIRFRAFGVEADEAANAIAVSKGMSAFHGTVFDAGFADHRFDVAAMYHVIEHFPDPLAVMKELSRVIKPGGWLAIETPDIDNIWFRLLGSGWRQFIPDHVYFFTTATLGLLCEKTGFEVVSHSHVPKSMSLRLFISRVGRYNHTVSSLLSILARAFSLEESTLRLNPRDVLRIYARRRS